MTDLKYRPSMRVKMTLTNYWQEKLLFSMSEHLGISETEPGPHVVYCREREFVAFLADAAKRGFTPNFEQLKVVLVDIKKEPKITVVRGSGLNNYNPLHCDCDDEVVHAKIPIPSILPLSKVTSP